MEALYKYIALGLALLAGVVFAMIRYRRSKFHDESNGFEYVYVNEDGSVRELDSEEQNYLQEEFHGADGNRPYIRSYESLTPDKKIWGFISRNRVPKEIEIKKIEP